MTTLKLEEGQRLYTLTGGWKWYDLQVDDWSSPLIGELRTEYPNTSKWFDLISSLKGKNYMSVRFPDGVNPIIVGSILYTVASGLDEERKDEQLYFYIDQNVLITFNLDEHTRGVMGEKDRISMLHQCKRPIDGMFVLSRAILHYFHAGMDKFEARLREVESVMREHNQRNLMDNILSSRFELLYWSNLFIPFQELIAASKEGYLDTLEDSKYYQQLLHRVERMEKLFQHYEEEIDTLVSIDDAIAGFRGNEIMKTLTIITVIFTPTTVVGAIWGMNFENLPITKVSWGFLVAILFTLVLTVGMYVWMYMKGWTGDLLRVRAKNKNI
ncbi:magnesium transporter CorA family protein [Paenibacillus uliginis]|nr:magnesium transporter CorA family protein [Paenibacillus uliginis]